MEDSGATREGQPQGYDFSIRVATVNGTGSQSANLVLLRTFFRMGIMASGKNLFPSNISGLPTWFTIRASEAGWIGNRRDHEVLVALNKETAAADLAELNSGGLAFVDEKAQLDERTDITVHRIPFSALVREACPEPRLRKLVTNMIYVGLLAQQLGLDMEEAEAAIARQFEGKTKAIKLNVAAARTGFDWAAAKLPAEDRFRVHRSDAAVGKILVEGNRAGAYGAIFGGVQVVAWYPITPSSSLPEAALESLPELRLDPETGAPTFAVIQAEDELAALGTVVGAGWAGARAMTATSGPGISLMTEFAGLAYFTETPAVVVDVQRMGPSTGLPTRTSQGDILLLALLSHGDTQHPVLFPAGPKEYFAMTAEALDVAQRLQTIVFVAADLDLGMNYWIDDPFEYPEAPLDRGKVLSAQDLEEIESFGRYRDVDGDGIPYRTLPGNLNPKSSFFTRGSGHDENAKYLEAPEVNIATLERLKRKLYDNLDLLPKPEIDAVEGAAVGVIAYGTSHWAVAEARARLAGEGVATSYLRLRSWPCSQEVYDFIGAHDRVYVVEQNRDGQMTVLLREGAPKLADRLRPVCYVGGLSLPVEEVVDGILAGEREN